MSLCFRHHISLKHNMSGRYLTSEGGNHYETGSGQQVVFAGGWEAAPEATFIVMPDIGVDVDDEVDVNFGDVVRLKHLTSRANLHSHADVPSPVTEVQQEVSCYGDDFTSDENDVWIVEQWTCDDEENEEFDPEDAVSSCMCKLCKSNTNLGSLSDFRPGTPVALSASDIAPLV